MTGELGSTAAYLGTLDCVHCGLCIEQCPTYRLTGRESANPRGRVYMLRALLEGRQPVSADMQDDLDLCLVCRACETACPSGVPFAAVLTEMRGKLRQRGIIRRRLMDRVLTSERRLALLMGLARLYQVSGLRLLRFLLPARLKRMEAYLPPVPPRTERRPLPATTQARGASRGRVALLEGCLMRPLFGDVGRNTIALLAAAGYTVEVPADAGCCGALHEHDGALERARELVSANVMAWSAAPFDAIVTNSAGCGAVVREYGQLLDTGEARRVGALAVDVCRFLCEHGGALEFGELRGRATYDAPCHLHHGQRETTAPLTMLGRIPGLELVPLRESERCCGAAGVWNLDHPEESAAILEEKLDALEASGASILVTGNPGCLLQWRAGIKQRGLAVEALHPVTLLARALDAKVPGLLPQILPSKITRCMKGQQRQNLRQ